jgi:uncharacterized protein (TIGR01777 family)
MKITVSGASGTIGRRLLKTLAAEGHSVQALSRHAGTNMPRDVKVWPWNPAANLPPEESLRDADAVIHLAGEPVAQRWTADARRRIRDSRVNGTRHLVQAMEKLARRPAVLIAGSAVGYYGSRGEETLTEDSPPGSDFLVEVCVAWEREARAAEALGVRVVRVRTGLVLDGRGGALARMLPPFRLGLGGRLGDGRQWMSWIHVEDLTGMMAFALDHPLSGAMNGVAPQPLRNRDFTKALAGALHRPAIFPVPALALRILFGEMSEILLASQRVAPRAAENAGYPFRFPELAGALADALKYNKKDH